MRQVEVRDNTIDKKLKKFKSDKLIIDGYFRALEDLKSVSDPTTIGERKHGKYRFCFAVHITKSHSLIYLYLREKDLVQLIDLDDHKALFRRDNKS